jgi:hypothetical protein
MAKATTEKNTEDETTAISVREVKKSVWKNFKKLAVLNDMSIQEYLEHVTNQELKSVQISKKRA